MPGFLWSLPWILMVPRGWSLLILLAPWLSSKETSQSNEKIVMELAEQIQPAQRANFFHFGHLMSFPLAQPSDKFYIFLEIIRLFFIYFWVWKILANARFKNQNILQSEFNRIWLTLWSAQSGVNHICTVQFETSTQQAERSSTFPRHFTLFIQKLQPKLFLCKGTISRAHTVTSLQETHERLVFC